MNVKNIVQFSIGPIGAAALSLITLPFVAWFFSVEDVGRLTMLQVALSLSVSLFSLAMHQAYVREYNEENDKAALLKHAVLPGLIVLTAFLALLLFSPWSISKLLFNIDSSLLSWFLVIGIYCSYLINFFAHVVRMEERGLVFSATQILPKLFLLIFIGFIFLLNLRAEFQTLMLMNVLAVASSVSIFAWLTRTTWLPAIKKPLNRELMHRMLTFSLPLVAGGIAYWGLTTMDRFFLRSYSGFEELGVYALAVALAGVVSVLSVIFSNLWHPVFYKWVKNGIDKSKVLNVIECMLLAVCLIWSLAGVFSFVLVYFLPPEYSAIEYLIVACIAMPLFIMLSETTGVGIGITRRSSFSMLASICAFVVNAILNYMLIPDLGASGAAIATLLAFFTYFVVRTEATAKLWWSFPRVKIYSVVICYITLTVLMVLSESRFDYLFIAWFLLLLSVLVVYFNRVKMIVSEMKNIIKGA
ncbi:MULTISPECIES: lipopolysaccharide biosynthesis protein [unclassified Shewanella]|uniref:lipopolysaccharide biosynthesis protein n=1 Tax=unclassified Shewanella TaxID=196818 RepID=UPI0021D8B241|nr:MULTISPECIES: oligosaccharide flippase family protein [unclassified Shewanella]MCU7961488.1 oligosaccharide flippase family protein [Shewanella sp. SW32]MCU7969570.1 oligosaccharide flippase family protein [Shewanella sp. SW29]MCU8001465.1 oligosaccharide flippase family protein [Shewanella sp. SM96]MCU8059853.1 oligosaccharide flippase family protein [Shewanella sp. SM55]